MNAVAADHRRAALLGKPLAALARSEARAPRGVDSRAAPAQVQALLPDARPERFEEHGLQVSAVDRELRPRVACVAAQWLAPDELAEAVEEARLLRGHCHARERVLQPQLA